jgi:hypothetical protein
MENEPEQEDNFEEQEELAVEQDPDFEEDFD